MNNKEKYRTYYVIVDMNDLSFMKDGCDSTFEECDKYEDFDEAQLCMNQEYDSDFKGAIYEVLEYIKRELRLIRKKEQIQ